MKVTADTNVLVRAITGDHAQQSAVARTALAEADTVAVPLTVFCELAWVLGQGYKASLREIADAINGLIGAANVAANRPAVAAGLAALDEGGDFADGVIAHEGRWLGGEALISFDRKAVKLLTKRGHSARLLG